VLLDVSEITGPVLVVAPHPDDETLGCGGLIASLCQKPIAVHTVFVTDGGSSHRQSGQWPRKRISALREQEAEEALFLLGAAQQDRTFLRLPDAAMPPDGTPEYEIALKRVEQIVATLRPSHAFLPWRRDPHCDHRDSWSLFTAGFRQVGHYPQVLEYAIWLDELGTGEDFPTPGEVERVELDISRQLDLKRSAITAHRSQLGEIILDDPTGFSLTPATLDRLIKPIETFWRSCPAP